MFVGLADFPRFITVLTFDLNIVNFILLCSSLLVDHTLFNMLKAVHANPMLLFASSYGSPVCVTKLPR